MPTALFVVATGVYTWCYFDIPILSPIDAPLPWKMDILEFAKTHPPYWMRLEFHPSITQADGTIVPCRYWDCAIDRAEDFLREKYPRPYTIGQVLRWYEEERATREHGRVFWSSSRLAVIRALVWFWPVPFDRQTWM